MCMWLCVCLCIRERGRETQNDNCLCYTVNSAWLLDYDHKSPPQVYFCTSKLQVWANVADQAKEAIDNCRDLLAPYFEKTHRDIVSQLTGQLKGPCQYSRDNNDKGIQVKHEAGI